MWQPVYQSEILRHTLIGKNPHWRTTKRAGINQGNYDIVGMVEEACKISYHVKSWRGKGCLGSKNREDVSITVEISFNNIMLYYISYKEFESCSWLPVIERFNQCSGSTVFKYFNNTCLSYLNENFKTAPQSIFQPRDSFQKSKYSLCKTSHWSNHLEQKSRYV